MLNGPPVLAEKTGDSAHPPNNVFDHPLRLPTGISQRPLRDTRWRTSNSASPRSRLGWNGSRSPWTKFPLLTVMLALLYRFATPASKKVELRLSMAWDH